MRNIKTISILVLILNLGLKVFGQFKTVNKYDYVRGPINGFAEGRLGEKVCLIDSNGNQLTPCIYDRIGVGTLDFSNGIAVVIRNGKYGYLNGFGQEIIDCKYECALNFSEGLAAVKLYNKWGFINKFGKFMVSNIYDSATAGFFHEGDIFFSKGIARVILNGKAIFINKKGYKIKDCPYDRFEPFYSDRAAVKKNGHWGFIDSTLSLVIPCLFVSNREFNNNGGSWNYPFAPSFHGNFCNVTMSTDALYNVIDKYGRTLLPWCRLIIPIPGKGQHSVILRTDGKLAIINNDFKIIADEFFDEVFADVGFDLNEGSRNWMYLDSKEDKIRVRQGNKYGFVIISKMGQNLIPCIYDEAEDFINGKAKVKSNGIYFYIDEQGNKTK